MLDKVEEIKNGAIQELNGIEDAKELEAWRVHYLGKKSPLTQILRGLAALPIEERKAVGACQVRWVTMPSVSTSSVMV